MQNSPVDGGNVKGFQQARDVFMGYCLAQCAIQQVVRCCHRIGAQAGLKFSVLNQQNTFVSVLREGLSLQKKMPMIMFVSDKTVVGAVICVFARNRGGSKTRPVCYQPLARKTNCVAAPVKAVVGEYAFASADFFGSASRAK